VCLLCIETYCIYFYELMNMHAAAAPSMSAKAWGCHKGLQNKSERRRSCYTP
jgi:hypothetical protein